MVRKQAQKKKNEWPCGGCRKNCVNSCVFCVVCDKWFHSACEDLSADDLKLFSEIPEDYVCVLCRSDDGKFDFLMGMERIKKASESGGEKLKSVLRREAAFLSDAERHVNVVPTTLTNMDIDPIADRILQQCHFQIGQSAIKSTGDGDCLFNSVSILLVGDESLAVELRYKTCLEMYVNRDKIQDHKDRGSFHALSPTYDTALKHCARPRQYSSVWNLLALSNVVNLPMDVLYPAVNGTNDLAFKKLNMSIRPKEPFSSDTIKIMWSSSFEPRLQKWWTPNHFVPVVPQSCAKGGSYKDVNFSFKFEEKHMSTPMQKPQPKVQNKARSPPSPPISIGSISPPSSPFVPSPKVDKKRPTKNMPIRRKPQPQPQMQNKARSPPSPALSIGSMSPPSSPFVPSPKVEKKPRTKSTPIRKKPLPKMQNKVRSPPSPAVSIGSMSPPSSPPSPPRVKKRPRAKSLSPSPSPNFKKRPKPLSPLSASDYSFHSSFNVSNRFSVFEDDEDDIEDMECNQDEEDPRDTPLKDLPDGQFLSIASAYKIITTSKTQDFVNKIPPGPKQNVFVLVQRTVSNKYEFPDDCGVWGRAGTTVNSTFVEKDDSLKTVVVRDNLLCVEKKIQNQRHYIPIKPQPEEDVVVKCHRSYSKLKTAEEYKRRVTIFTKLPPHHQDKEQVAIVEYLGSYNSEKIPHGNCTKASVPYVRTDPAILQEAARITRESHQKPLKTSHQMMLEDSINAPNAKQIRDKVYRDSKKTDNGQHTTKLHNIADEVLSVLSMCQNGENNVREVFVSPSKPPSVVVYSDEQLEDLRTNCNVTNGSVIGIDRTFNLGPCFVTTTTYKNQKILKRETLQNPIFLGPTFLHWDGETGTYYKFLCHLNAKLGYPSQLKIGSDEEKAIKNAIQQAFHDPVHLLCTKHLKDNVRRYLKDKEGCGAKEREFIVKLIFGYDGLVNSDDSFSFESKIADMESRISKFPNFRNYFDKRLKPLLLDHVFKPLQNGTVGELWTNNNSESMNNRLKESINWKPHKLPDLISKINEISAFQFNDLRRSIHGNGNYILEDTFKNHHVSPDVWVKLSQTEKRKRTWKLLSQKPRDAEKKNYIKSTKCSFQVPPTAKIAQKPHQRKRPRAERVRR